MIIQTWRNRKSDIFLSAVTVVAVILAGIFSVPSLRSGDRLAVGLFIFVIGWLAYQTVQIYKERDHDYLIIRVEEELAKSIVEKVLKKVNFSPEQTEYGYFMPEDGLMIQVSKSIDSPRGLFITGTSSSISIGPIDEGNASSANRLKELIATGFQATSRH